MQTFLDAVALSFSCYVWENMIVLTVPSMSCFYHIWVTVQCRARFRLVGSYFVEDLTNWGVGPCTKMGACSMQHITRSLWITQTANLHLGTLVEWRGVRDLSGTYSYPSYFCINDIHSTISSSCAIFCNILFLSAWASDINFCCACSWDNTSSCKQNKVMPYSM